MTGNKAPDEAAPQEVIRARALNDVPRERRCLRCDTAFWSEGFGERICRRCKAQNAWRNGVAFDPGTSRGR